jgi:signal peptidase I
MEDTLLIGDQILVCKFIYGPKIPCTDINIFDFHKPAHGDVFVFIPPHNRRRNFIKRIVAVEGDTVYTEGGILYVNGQPVDESGYIKHVSSRRFKRHFPPFRSPAYLPDEEEFADYTLTPNQFNRKFPEGNPYTVPKGKVFAMGDNREQSSDSRTWGPVAIEDIKGQAFMVYWSFKNRPIKLWEFWKVVGQVRFRRIGKLISSGHKMSHFESIHVKIDKAIC